MHRDNLGDPTALAMAQALGRIESLYKSIHTAQVNDDDRWFQNLLCGILSSALIDYDFLDRGIQESVYLAAWSTRNLLELKTITEYVLGSNHNAIAFKDDLVIDAKEFYEALSNHHKATHEALVAMLLEVADHENSPNKELFMEAHRREIKQGPQTAETDAEAAAFKQLMGEYGMNDKAKPKHTSAIAEILEQRAAFQPLFKICSKIMHRTTLSIASTNEPHSLDSIKPFLENAGAFQLLAIYAAIKAHYDVRGARPSA